MAPNLEEGSQGLIQQKGKKTVSQQPVQPAMFHARIDGGIPTYLRDGVGLIAIFEVKRSRRDDNDEVRVQDYLFERGSTKVVPSDLDVDVTPYLFIQELGPFNVNSKRDLRAAIRFLGVCRLLDQRGAA